MHFPYRWSCWGGFWGNIRWIPGMIYWGIKNIIIWTPVIWEDRDYDWGFLAKIMEFKFRKMSEYHTKWGVTINKDKMAQELMTCAELLKRIREDDPKNISSTVHEARMNEWTRMLGDTIGKKLRLWWD